MIKICKEKTRAHKSTMVSPLLKLRLSVIQRKYSPARAKTTLTQMIRRGFFFEEDAENRHDHNIKGCDEAGFSDGCHRYAVLLQSACNGNGDAAAQAADQECLCILRCGFFRGDPGGGCFLFFQRIKKCNAGMRKTAPMINREALKVQGPT